MPCASRAAMPSWWNAWPRCAPTTDAIRRASQKHGGCLRCRRPYSDFQTAGENPMSEEDIHAAGMKVRRRILGDTHVDRAVANTTPLNRELQDLLTRYGWGEIWTRPRSEEHTSELQSLMRISYAVFCLKTKKKHFTA